MKVLHTIANNADVPYFEWFAEAAQTSGSPELQFAFLVSPPAVGGKAMERFGVRSFTIPFDPSKRAASMIKATGAAWRLLRRERPDVVHTHLFDDSLPVLLAAWVARVPTRVITKQDTAFHWHYAKKAVWFDRLNNLLASHVVAVSTECETFVRTKERANPKKMRRVLHGIPIELYAPPQPREAIDEFRRVHGFEGRIVFGTVARFIEWKGHRELLEAAASVVKSEPRALFAFAGSGPLREELEEIVRSLGLEDHVLFLGGVPRSEIPLLYQSMDVFLHTARMEPFGFVIAEAMASGSPIVTTPTGAAVDGITDGVSGILCVGSTAADITDGVLRCLAMGEPERASMGAKARERATERFSIAQMIDGYRRIYEEAVPVVGSKGR